MKISVQVAVGIFGLVALFHLLRLVLGWNVRLGTWTAAVWLSVVGLLVACGMAIWLWKE